MNKPGVDAEGSERGVAVSAASLDEQGCVRVWISAMCGDFDRWTEHETWDVGYF